MQNFNTITVGTFLQVEAGDLITMAFLDYFISGRVEAVVRWPFQLTEDQIAYMKKQNLNIPENKYMPLGGHTSALYFGDFYGPGTHDKHMFVDDQVAVAVFTASKSD